MNSNPPGRRAQKEATRHSILQVARSHFEQHGYQATNLRAIADQAGVSAGTVLLHFTDKLGLLHAALHDDLEQAIDKSLRRRQRGSLLQHLCAIVRPFYAYYAARPELSKTLLRESLLAESPWRERFSEQVLRVNARVLALVEGAKRSGELGESTRSEIFATAFLSFYYMVLIGWLQGGVAKPLPLFSKLMAQHIAGCDGGRPAQPRAPRGGLGGAMPSAVQRPKTRPAKRPRRAS